MATIDEVLEALEDGEWHEIVGLLDKIEVSGVKLGIALAFLAEYEFIEMDEKRVNARLVPQIQTFLKEIKKLDCGGQI